MLIVVLLSVTRISDHLQPVVCTVYLNARVAHVTRPSLPRAGDETNRRVSWVATLSPAKNPHPTAGTIQPFKHEIILILRDHTNMEWPGRTGFTREMDDTRVRDVDSGEVET